jgi:hypothetical protein
MVWTRIRDRSSSSALLFIAFLSIPCRYSMADDKISLPILWAGIEGAPSMEDPSVVNEESADNVLWRRHERPTDAIYLPMADVSFRSAATAEIKNGPVSFPIIRDPSGSDGNVLGLDEMSDAFAIAKRAWRIGDPLYLDVNDDGVANDGQDTLLSDNNPQMGFVELGHDGAPLMNAPDDVRFVDLNGNTVYDFGETLYRDENGNEAVDDGDTRLNADSTVVGNISDADEGEPLLNVPSTIKFFDVIREPANTFHIGNPSIKGILAVNANDFHRTDTDFPTHGTADPDDGNPLTTDYEAVMLDDPSQYLPPNADYELFETNLVGHEFGHVLGLPHGNTPEGGGDAATYPNGDPYGDEGTLCTSNNMMQYCWIDTGDPGEPDLEWVGDGMENVGVITEAQRDVIRSKAEDFLQSMGMGVMVAGGDPAGRRVATRVDVIGEVPEDFGFVDIGDFGVAVDGPFTELSLRTRRPLLTFGLASSAQYVFALDVDGDRDSGGSPADIAEENIPTDFSGAEFVVVAELFPGGALEVRLYEHNAGVYAPVDDDGIGATRETIEAVVDVHADSGEDFRIAEQILVSLPNELLGSFESRFRVEYLAAAVELTNPVFVDRATADAVSFDNAVYPECMLDQLAYHPGDQVTVTAGDVLPNSHAHVFLGVTEVGAGITDDDGSVTIDFTVPVDAALGERLVTVGTLAVTADCFLQVVPEPSAAGLTVIALSVLLVKRVRKVDLLKHEFASNICSHGECQSHRPK